MYKTYRLSPLILDPVQEQPKPDLFEPAVLSPQLPASFYVPLQAPPES